MDLHTLISPLKWNVAKAIETLNFYGLGDAKRGHRYDGKEIFTESDKLYATPLIRKFIPKVALYCYKYDLLETLQKNLPASVPGLVELIRDAVTNLRVWKKIDTGSVATIESVTRNGHLGILLSRQKNRCCICGVLVISLKDGCMHLDHIIPRALGGGDPGDRSNWRVLCSACNIGKREHLSALSVPETWGQPGRTEGREVSSTIRTTLGNLAEWWEPTPRMRYAAYAIARGCAFPGCEAKPHIDELHIQWEGCPTVPFATVLCTKHYQNH